MQYVRKTSKEIKENFLNELLQERNILPHDEKDIYNFFHVSKENEYDANLLDNIEEGYQLLLKHLKNNSSILIIVDPDCDGYTSAALFYNYLTDILSSLYDFTLSYHIPQGKEHGLRCIMSELENEKKYDLIVLPDSSSNDYEQHKILSDMGYDLLVLDHHLVDKYSENAIVINNQLSKNYPNKFLSGVGVVYKFLEYFEKKLMIEKSYKPMIKEYLDLVALGEIGDMMNMQTFENRYICDCGLSNINNSLFREIIKKQCYPMLGIRPESWTNDYYTNGEITQIKVAFYVTPLINALIRVGTQNEKEILFRSFIEGDKQIVSTKRGGENTMETITEQSTRNCVNARNRQNREKEKAIELLDIQISDNCLDENKILILQADDLNVSNNLTGLIAGEIASKYKKPTMLGRISPDGYLKGSVRGREESELKDFKKFLQDSNYMSYVEGHANAAGFGMSKSDISKLQSYANEKLKDVNFNEGYYEADFIVNENCSYLKDLILDLDNGKKLWGQGNPEPIIVVENIVVQDYQIIGKNQDTLKFIVNDISYIKFKAENIIEELEQTNGKNLIFTVVGKGNLNYWNGNCSLQILCSDLNFIELKGF